MNKKNTNFNKKESTGLFESSKILNDIYDAEYDLSQLQILTVDGVIPFLDSDDGSRLLFFHNIPSVEINKDKKEKNLNKCLVEIRMTTSTLKMISEIINFEIQCFEKNQNNNKNYELKNNNHENEHLMFG